MLESDDHDAAVSTLLSALPGLRSTQRELFAHFEGDVTPQVVFNALAEEVDAMLRAGDVHADELEDRFAALERVAALGGIDAIEAVAFSFLDALSPEGQLLAASYFGPETERLARRLAADEVDFEDFDDRDDAGEEADAGDGGRPRPARVPDGARRHQA